MLTKGLVFGLQTGGSRVRPTLEQFVVENQLRFHQPGERQQRRRLFAFEIDGDMVAVDAGELTLESFSPFGEAIELEPRASQPSQIAKSFNRVRGRSTPGLDTSRVYRPLIGSAASITWEIARASAPQSSTSMAPSARSAMTCNRLV